MPCCRSLEKDAEELETLIAFLSARYASLKRIVLIGFSTGCQDMVTLLRRRKVTSLIKVGSFATYNSPSPHTHPK